MCSPLPLATVDDLRASLLEIDDQLMALGVGRVVDVARLEERRRILHSWRDRLSAQLVEMESGSRSLVGVGGQA